jgi:excisionase family DNA binding protein
MNIESPYGLGSQKIMTVLEVSEILNIGKNKVYSMLEAGELRGFKVGKLWRVCFGDIDDYIKNHYSTNG